jgi:hypothetical protein
MQRRPYQIGNLWIPAIFFWIIFVLISHFIEEKEPEKPAVDVLRRDPNLGHTANIGNVSTLGPKPGYAVDNNRADPIQTPPIRFQHSFNEQFDEDSSQHATMALRSPFGN